MAKAKKSKRSQSSHDRGTPKIDTAGISKPPTPKSTSSRSSTSSASPTTNFPTDHHLTAPPLPTPAPIPQPMHPPTPRTIPLLICSIGNPSSTYAHTLHSAGHTVLSRLQTELGYPAFRKNRALGNGLVSEPPPGLGNWTLWQSTSLMNVSGKGVKAAYKGWLEGLPEVDDAGGDGDGVGADSEKGKQVKGRLIVVHDELERTFGTVRVNTRQGASVKGHNGLKSIGAAMSGTEWMRIGIGIGRPESRESRDVASFVLRKMTGEERGRMEACVQEVVRGLRELERG